jgi:hypothetical protein
VLEKQVPIIVMRSALFLVLIGIPALSQRQQQPNIAAQREAMTKLDFLVGKWSGDAQVRRGPGESIKLLQTEEVQFKLDGLVLLIEGTGRTADGQIAFQALATISYDDGSGTYRFRAYNGGRYLDTELTVVPRGFTWGYTSGPVKIANTMRLNEKGDWIETTETTFSSSPPSPSVMMTLHRQH